MAHAHSFQIEQTEKKGLKRAYKVVVGAKEIDAHIDMELKRVGANVKIAGFRPGKVPPHILKQRYGKSVLSDVVEHLVDYAVKDTLEKYQEAPALKPKVEISEFKEGGDLAIALSYEVLPTSPEIDFSKISIERPVSKVSDKEMEESLGQLAKNNRRLLPKEGMAENGDVLTIDFTGYLGDTPFEGGEAKHFNLELGSGAFIPGFEEQLIGASAQDEREVTVTFPKDYHKEDLKGQKARFVVKVHQVNRVDTPPADEELAKSLGVESLDKLKEMITAQLDREYNEIARNYIKKQLFDALEAECDYEIPEGMFKLEFDSIWQQVLQAKKKGDSDLDKPEEELREEYEKIARRRVALGILLSQTAGRHKLEVSTEDLRNAIIEQARNFPGQERKVLEFYNKHPEEVNQFRGPILEEKAVDFILTQVKQTDTEMSRETLLDPDALQAKPAKKKSEKSSEGGAKKRKSETKE